MLDKPLKSKTSSAPFNYADLAGRSAIVTGSTSGIGLGIARAFAACGMNVLLNGFGERNEIDRTVAGALAVFLCSSSARSITGAAIPIEGGWTAQ